MTIARGQYSNYISINIEIRLTERIGSASTRAKRMDLISFISFFPEELKPKHVFGNSKVNFENGVWLLKDALDDALLDQYIAEHYKDGQHYGYCDSGASLNPGRAISSIADVIMAVGDDVDHVSVDLELVRRSTTLSPTKKQQLIDARRGQGKFRKGLDKLWSSTCPVSAHSTRELLRASHIKSWRESNDKQRLDPYNGILLSANIDALFDKHLVTFSDDGSIMFSTRLPRDEALRLQISETL